jgi:hypothetical protein
MFMDKQLKRISLAIDVFLWKEAKHKAIDNNKTLNSYIADLIKHDIRKQSIKTANDVSKPLEERLKSIKERI